jgi:hypothetical protein
MCTLESFDTNWFLRSVGQEHLVMLQFTQFDLIFHVILVDTTAACMHAVVVEEDVVHHGAPCEWCVHSSWPCMARFHFCDRGIHAQRMQYNCWKETA